MSTLKKSEPCSCTAEERLSKVGRKIDQLIERAHNTKQELQEREKIALKRGGTALDELKIGLDKAWHELHQAWLEVKPSAERAATHPESEEVPCSLHSEPATESQESAV